MPGIHSPIRELTPNGTTLSTRELLRSAVVESDGVAFDMLLIWAPPADVTRMVRKLKVDSMAIVATERAMVADPKLQSRNWSTPLATVQLLRALQVGHALSAPSRVLLMGWLAESTPNDVGVVMLPNGQHLATVVFFKDSKATKAQREATVAKIARAALDAATRDKR